MTGRALLAFAAPAKPNSPVDSSKQRDCFHRALLEGTNIWKAFDLAIGKRRRPSSNNFGSFQRLCEECLMFRKRGLVILLSLLAGLLPAALRGQFAQRSSIS